MATDFSVNAEKSLEYAISLVNAQPVNIYLVHVFNTPAKSGKMSLSGKVKENFEEKIQQLVDQYTPVINEESTLEGKVLQGEPATVLIRSAHINEIDVIFAGTQGVTQDPMISIGKTSGKMIKQSDIPLLLIPENTPITKPNEILFCFRQLLKNVIHTIVPLSDLLMFTRAQLKAAHVICTEEDKIKLDLLKLFNHVDVPFIELESENILTAANHIYKTQSYSIMAMVLRKRGIFQKAFATSRYTKVEFDVRQPIFLMPEITL